MEKIMKLKEVNNDYEHYFVDDDFKLQGEFKRYYPDSKLEFHAYFKDDNLHGEYKRYFEDGSLIFKRYYSNGQDITDMYNKLNVWKSL